MTLEQKIEHLKDAAMQEARAEGNAIMKQHEDALEGVFEQHKAEALRQSETRIKAEGINARQQLNMAMSKAQGSAAAVLRYRRQSSHDGCVGRPQAD